MVNRYKLTYFDMRGMAEQIRLLLADNKIPFEERRYTKEEDAEWQKAKGKLPFGQVPVLQDDDELFAQSGAIMRHLARKHDLYGRTESEHTFADMFYDGLADWHRQYAKTVYQNFGCGNQNFEEVRAEYLKNELPKALGMIERLLKTHDNGEHYVLGDKVCFVDYLLFDELDVHLALDGSCLRGFPALAAFHGRFNQRPSLQVYLMKRATSKTPINWSGNAN